uniref:Glycine N-acyltransferase-like protein n=1 Tax=Pelusios castaneus TaxID=367368 RepID=A0A8C8SBL4_9SAUR
PVVAGIAALPQLSSHPFPPLWQVHGSVRTINHENPAGHEVLVDTWPDFKVVCTQPRTEVPFLINTLGVEALRWLLPGTHPTVVAPVLWAWLGLALDSRIYSPGVKHDSDLLLPQLDQILSIVLVWAKGVRLLSLDVSHMDLVNEMWAMGGNKHSRRYLESLIRRFPNFCLLDTSDSPVCWGLSDMFGAMMCSFTLPQHRGHGHNGSPFPSQQWLLLIYPTKPQHAHLPPSAAWLLLPHFPWTILPSVLCL